LTDAGLKNDVLNELIF